MALVLQQTHKPHSDVFEVSNVLQLMSIVGLSTERSWFDDLTWNCLHIDKETLHHKTTKWTLVSIDFQVREIVFYYR